MFFSVRYSWAQVAKLIMLGADLGEIILASIGLRDTWPITVKWSYLHFYADLQSCCSTAARAAPRECVSDCGVTEEKPS